MNHLRPRWISAAMALSALVFVATTLGQDLAEFSEHVTEFSLENGLKFIVLERREAPVVMCLTYVNVGAVDGAKARTGLAHLLEHLAFEGTQTIGTTNYESESAWMTKMDETHQAIQTEQTKGAGADKQRLVNLHRVFEEARQQAQKLLVRSEFQEILKRAGGIGLSATTNYDATVYTARLPSNKLELWMLLESDRFLHPVFRRFYEEKDIVMEERRQQIESNPVGRLGEEFLAAAFRVHPYGKPSIGYMSDLNALTRPEVGAFFDRYYCPTNLTIVLAGDVQPEKVRELARAYFGRLPYRPAPDPMETEEPPQIEERRVTVELVAQPLVLIGYHKPNMHHSDEAVFNAIMYIAGSGRTARLHMHLVKERKIAMSATCLNDRPGRRYPGLFVFYAVPAKDHTNDECEEAIYAEIERLKNEPVSQEELQTAKVHARAGLIRQLDSLPELARQLACFKATTGDWRNVFHQLDQIGQVTPEDIQRVARTYLVVKNRTVGMIKTVAAVKSCGAGVLP